MSIRAFTSIASNSKAQNWLSVITYPILFLSLHILSGFLPSTNTLPISPLELAAIEALKLAFNVLARYRSQERHNPPRQTQTRTVLWDASRDFEEQPLQGMNGRYDGEGEQVAAVFAEGGHSTSVVGQESIDAAHALSTRSRIAVAFASVAWASTTYIFTSALFFFDAPTVHFASATSTVLVLYAFYALFGRGVTVTVCQSVALQVCRDTVIVFTWPFLIRELLGSLLAKNSLSRPSQSHHSLSLILLAVSFASACNVFLIQNTYRSHAATLQNRLDTVLFSSGMALHVLIYASQAITMSPLVSIPDVSLHRISMLIIRARLDWTTLSVIRDHDAILERVLYSLSLALLLLIISLHNKLLSLTLLAGSVVALWGSISYASRELYKSHHLHVTAEADYSVPTRRRRFIAFVIFTLLGLGSILGATKTIHFRSAKPLASLFSFPSPSRPVCRRRPLHVSPLRASHSREYRHFDDVLLIIFFSHARYDTNLDSYREVYSEFFPNIVFVGPASREGAGFDHSYDVLVDTYQAAEDLSDIENYKMGGRMAHHMLYSALQEHPCYDGYLWAPFDTLLNVPRLQLFNQNKFWYHSPFGRYVPNRALSLSAIRDASFHAPPANISPDPANMTTPWKGWGEDWWWGSPHVGLPVCMRAFNQVPTAQRDRLAALTGERDRLIGGSADTMYIPGRHREAFMSVLALFLRTNCFLEIAAPTALHLALPPNEEILYVDHYWIWQPPFDAAFVREQWAKGREVDTFHSFHWGETSRTGGVWEPRPERVEEVRQLLEDSAVRQGISFPKSTHSAGRIPSINR